MAMIQEAAQGLQSIPFVVDGTLGAISDQDNAVWWNSIAATEWTQSFLLKKIKVNLVISTLTDDEFVYLHFGVGGPTNAQIETILESEAEYEDPSTADAQAAYANLKQVFHQAGKLLGQNAEGNGDILWNETISIGGKKGIPLNADQGIAGFAYAPLSQITTGAFVGGIITLVGVFLND